MQEEMATPEEMAREREILAEGTGPVEDHPLM